MGSVMESTVTSKGQVTLPAETRRLLGIRAGDRLRWTVCADGSLQVRKVQAGRLEALVGMLGQPGKSVSVDEMNEAIRQRFKTDD